jgi:hypothetical protein
MLEHAVGPTAVRRISGDVEPGGSSLVLRFETDGNACDLRLTHSDAAGLVKMLLALNCVATLSEDAASGYDGSAPFIVESVSVGETAEGDAVVGLVVGSITLEFGLPFCALDQVARTLLATVARRKSQMQ